MYKIDFGNTIPTDGSTTFSKVYIEDTVGEVTPGGDRFVSVDSGGTSSIRTIDFYIYAYNDWGTEMFSDQITININCIATSTVVGLGAYPNTLTSTQQVGFNDSPGQTRFEIPGFTTSESDCPIVSYALDPASDAGLTLVQDPATTGPWFVVPTDKASSTVFTFKLIATAEGGATFTTADQTLDVGCTNAVITQADSFVTAPADLIYHASTLGAYTIVDPEINPSWCSVT